MAKILIAFVIGIVGGAAGLFGLQILQNDGTSEKKDSISASERSRLEKDLKIANARKATLAEKNADLITELAELRAKDASQITKLAEEEGKEESVGEAGAEDPANAVAKGAGKFIEAMMKMGAERESRQAAVKADALSERLGLTDDQRETLAGVIAKKLKTQQEAGVKLFSGKASIADLVAADEDNFIAFDREVMEMLDADQREEYAGFQAEREEERVGNKLKEEMGGLAGMALSDDQQERATSALEEIIRDTPPEEVPEGTTIEDFNTHFDGEINRRVEAMTPILNEDQLSGYQTQLDGFREMIGAMVGAATGEGE